MFLIPWAQINIKSACSADRFPDIQVNGDIYVKHPILELSIPDLNSNILKNEYFRVINPEEQCTLVRSITN